MEQEQTLFQTIGEQRSAAHLSQDQEPSLGGYKLERLVGAGSFGQVWAGVHERTGRKVGVKLLSCTLSSQALTVELDRLRVATDHPNIVDLLDADPEHEPPFLTMPWMSGGSLAEQPQPSASLAETWIRQIAQALRYIHAKGILHCDLKPANVLLDGEERAYLADFGQSLVLGGRSRAWGTMGTMPPEQALMGTEEKNSAPNLSWDIYALGATAYYLLTGQLPRLLREDLNSVSKSSSVEERLGEYRELLNRRPLRSVRELNPHVDRELAFLVESCLNLNPEERPATVDEFLLDLERRKNKQPLFCRRPWSVAYQVSCWMRRPVVALSVFFVCVAVGGLALGYARLNQANMNLNQANQNLSQVNAQLTNTMGQLMESRGDSLIGSSQANILWYAEALKALPDDTFLRRKVAKPFLTLAEIQEGAQIGFFQGEALCTVKDGILKRGSDTFPLIGPLESVSDDGSLGLAIREKSSRELSAYDLTGTPKILFEIEGSEQHISADGNLLTIFTMNLDLVVLNRQGNRLATLGNKARSLGFLDDSTLAYSPDRASVMLWRSEATRRLARLDSPPERVTLLGTDKLAIVTNIETRILRLSDGAELSRCPHAFRVYQLSEHTVLLTLHDKLEVRLIDGLHLIASFPHEGLPHDAAVSPDGSRFAVLNDRGVRLFQTDPPQELSPELPLFGGSGQNRGLIDGLQFSPSSRKLVTYSKETRVWDVLQTPAVYSCSDVSVAGWLGQTLIAGKVPEPFQVVKDGVVTEYEGKIESITVDGQVWELPDGTLHPILATSDNYINFPGTVLYDQKIVARRLNESIEVARFPSGEKIFSVDAEPMVGPILEPNGKQKIINGHPAFYENKPDGLALHPNGGLLAHSDKTEIRLVEIPSGRTLRTFQHEGVTSLEYDRTGRLLACHLNRLAGAEKNEIVVLDTESGKVVHRFENSGKASFSPEDDLLVVKARNDQSTAYSTEDWSPRYTFLGRAWFIPNTGLLARFTDKEIQLLGARTGPNRSPNRPKRLSDWHKGGPA